MIAPATPFDAAAYAARVASVECFVCAFLAGDPRFAHDVLLDDGEFVVFPNRYPTTPGQLLVVPRRHVEDLAAGTDLPQWLRLQAVVHRAAVALQAVVPCERVYVASLGSARGNRHLHVHVAAVPPGIPLERQQLVLLDAERSGVVRTGVDTIAALRRALAPAGG